MTGTTSTKALILSLIYPLKHKLKKIKKPSKLKTLKMIWELKMLRKKRRKYLK